MDIDKSKVSKLPLDKNLMLIKECKKGFYVNLDTQRLNKDTTMKNKKDLYINHKYKFFSQNESTYKLYVKKYSTNYIINIINLVKKMFIKTSNPTSHSIPKVKSRPTIPISTKNKVWREWCGNSLDSQCFCCLGNISYEKWHCGHILSHAHGGTMEPDNLRPICKECNLKMSSMHMYEYILTNNMKRILDKNNQEVMKYQRFINEKNKVEEILTQSKKLVKRSLPISGAKLPKLSLTEINNYLQKINSKRLPLKEKYNVINEIKKKLI